MHRRDDIYIILTLMVLVVGCICIYAMPAYQFTEAGEYEEWLSIEAEHESIAESAKAKIAQAQECDTVTYHEQTELDRQQEIFITDINLDAKLQQWIIKYCTEKKISPALVIAIIEVESDGDAKCIGDNGAAFGLMQIQTRWHRDRMKKLGIADLTNPKQNVQVGVDYLLELFDINPETQWVLDAFNGGQAYADKMQEKKIDTDYSQKILKRAAELERYLYGEFVEVE